MDHLSIGQVSERTGVAISALRYYEKEGLLRVDRTEGGQRRYPREVIRRVSFIRIAQHVGLSLGDIRDALETLPDDRTPTKADWARLSSAWRSRLDDRISSLTRLRDDLTSCIGCGCLSLKACSLYNPGDRAGSLGTGPRYLLSDDRPTV
jgi:MerR family transcriptional regulator, redox-sensitive transcriptional activator SoxR